MAVNKNILGEDLNNVRKENVAGVKAEAGFDKVFGGKPEAENPGIGVLGLSDASSLFISKRSNNEIMEAFQKGIEKAKSNFKIDIKIFKLDAEDFELGFSSFLYGYKSEAGNVYYFAALLEKTGREPLQVKTIVDSLNIKNSTDVLVTSDAFDDDYYSKASAVLKKAFGVNEDKLVSCEGAVIPSTADEEITGEIVSKYAHDVIISTAFKREGKMKDISVPQIVKYSQNGALTIDIGLNTGLTINMLGRHIRSDFNVSVALIRNSQFRSLNGQGIRKNIATASGYTEFIISEEMNQYTGQIKRVAEPMLVLNEFMGLAPTLNYGLLSIVNATTFTNRATLKKLIIEKDAGPLNFLFNYDGVPNKYGEKISFKDPKANMEIVNDIIRQHIKPAPIFAIEIEEFGADYPVMLPFAALSDSGARLAANEDIIRAAEELTGQKFVNRQVAANEGLYVPIGEYRDNNDNVRDLREIDTTFICAHANEPSLIIDWIYSNTPTSVCIAATGKDPYILKLEVIDKISSMLGIKPVITGRAVRVPLDAAFVSELVEKVQAAGYRPRLDNPVIDHNDFNNLQQIASAYASAAMGTTGFGAQVMTPGGYNFAGNRPFAYRR